MSTYLKGLIQSLEREAEETRAHLRTNPSRQPGRTIAEQNLKRIQQRLATLRDLQLPVPNRNKRPGRDNLSPNTA